MLPEVLPALLLAGWVSLPSLPPFASFFPRPHLPTWAERWLYNPRERTARAIDAYLAGDAEQAVDFADTALRLAPGDARTQFNDGTAQLGAGRRRQAIPLLEKAARNADSRLAPAAWYNLGNARLAAADAAGAVEAFKQALRLAPADRDAKHNLELALRERDRQRQRIPGLGEGSRGRRPQDSPRPAGGGGQGGPSPQEPGKQEQPQGQGQRPAGGRKPGDANGRSPQRFQNQPDMTAREAAALLQAVEGLERQLRRAQAAQRARRQSAKGKDW